MPEDGSGVTLPTVTIKPTSEATGTPANLTVESDYTLAWTASEGGKISDDGTKAEAAGTYTVTITLTDTGKEKATLATNTATFTVSQTQGQASMILDDMVEVEASSVLTSVTPTFAYNYDTEEGNMTVYVYKENIMNRLYNPNSGEHFYTHDTHERDVLVSLGWQAEGVGWVAPKASESTSPVYRLYNANAGDHHYTKDANEKDTLVTLGWTFEGVGWYSAADPEVGNRTIAVFREYNPNAKEAGAHNYTISENENATLVSLGWIDEGIAWNALK